MMDPSKVTVIIIFVLNMVGKNTNAKLFKKHSGSQNLWTPNIMTNLDNIGSLIQCGAICLRNGQTCGAFMYEEGICTLGTYVAGCGTNAPSGVEMFRIAQPGSSEMLYTGQAFTAQLTTAEEKKGWKLSTSSTYGNPVSRVIDGIIDSSQNSFATGGTTAHPWLQINLGERRWVKGFKMWSVTGTRQFSTEVRVGDQDVQGSPEDQILCQNHLCYMTDTDNVAPSALSPFFDCNDPLLGRYVTLQKYANYLNGPYNEKYIHVREVDIEVYCTPLNEDENTCHVDQSVNMCNNNDLITAPNLVTDSTTKDGWTLDYSSEGSSYPNPRKVLDGDFRATTNAAMFGSDESVDLWPWIQIGFAETKTVKGVHTFTLYTSTGGSTGMNLEVRVGDTDVKSIATMNQRLCYNLLCKMTKGAPHKTNNKVDCSGGVPIKGQYVTIQRMYIQGQLNLLGLAEVDIEFYD